MADHCVYRHFDGDGRLLYVGMSRNALVRTAGHANAADWYGRIATITIERFESRMAASEAEVIAIMVEYPEFSNPTKSGASPRKDGEMRGRKNSMTPDRVTAAEQMMADGVTAAAMLKALKDIDPDVGLSRSRVFDWRKDYAAINPDDLTDDR